MFQASEQDERGYLKTVIGKLQAARAALQAQIDSYADQVLEMKQRMWETQAEMDKAEKAASRISVSDEMGRGEEIIREAKRLDKLIASPYFGRIDFQEAGKDEILPVYLGIHSFIEEKTLANIIYDWRAPISSMFYDFESGPAYYTAPMGRIEGDISLKRQYRIVNSQMEYMIESAMNIDDLVLQKELSRTSDEKMKNIVATIQKEQNRIIRDEEAKVLIIQGSAGSGKTSIALHRVAFLLYRYKQILNSRNILILSPNKVFGSYISNVLPELGEENILEMSFEEVAQELLGKKVKFQTFGEQVSALLDNEDEAAVARIQKKATIAFVSQLDAFLEKAEKEFFRPEDVDLEFVKVSAEQLQQMFSTMTRLPIKQRLQKMALDLIAQYKRTHEQPLPTAVSRELKKRMKAMYPYNSAMQLYTRFYQEEGMEGLFCKLPKGKLEYCDVYPLLYVKIFYEGSDMAYQTIRHLLVDEMQDYTPIQYAVISKIFSCKMTILGDAHQSVNPYSSSSVEKIRPFFEGCSCVELCRSYRSTLEITRFAQKIHENKKLIPVERHGMEPQLHLCWDEGEQLEKIQGLIGEYKASNLGSLGIIAKSQKEAEALYERLKENYPELQLLTFASKDFQEGMIITSAHMAKGLEFDQVIVPNVDESHYRSDLDNSLLYIACTRAMHRLDLTRTGALPDILKD